jgi:hypothetical protein
MPKLTTKEKLGRLFGKSQNQAPASLSQTATTPITAETTVLSDTTGTITVTEMTPEQVTARNYAVLSKVSHNPPAHTVFLEFCKSTWRIIGPIAFIVFTAGEVYYYIKHFLPDDNSPWTQVLLWGITLLIEIPFAIATYDLSERKARAVEAKRAGHEPPDKDTTGAIIMWFAMALINIGGQMAFLFFITKAGDFNKDWPIYLFIAFRVIGVILGDAYVAFFLSPSPTKLSHVLRHQKAQGEGFEQLSNQHIERQIKESRAKMQIEHNQRMMAREKSDAEFLDQFHKMNAQAALQRQSRLLEIEGPDD